MTEIVRSPDPPLVDPETGETAPLSPPLARYLERLSSDPERFRKFVDGFWEAEPDNAA